MVISSLFDSYSKVIVNIVHVDKLFISKPTHLPWWNMFHALLMCTLFPCLCLNMYACWILRYIFLHICTWPLHPVLHSPNMLEIPLANYIDEDQLNVNCVIVSLQNMSKMGLFCKGLYHMLKYRMKEQEDHPSMERWWWYPTSFAYAIITTKCSRVVFLCFVPA